MYYKIVRTYYGIWAIVPQQRNLKESKQILDSELNTKN